LNSSCLARTTLRSWQAVEEIPFDRVRQLKATQQEKKQANMDLQTAMQQGMDKQAISGRYVR